MEEKGRRSRRDVLTDGNSSFLRAARAGNLDKVLEWLKGSIDINTSNANGLNALHLASKEGHINVVTELIKRGANVNAATKKGNTALHISSLAGKQEVVKILVQNGANVNVQSQNGFTPLYMAAQENHDDVLSFLLANGANQSLSTEDGFTPLAVALQQGHDKVVTILLENDTKGKVRLPALHIAAKKDDCKAATLLLQSDHNPDVTSKSGFTPLHIAAHYGNENIAMILLEKGADVNFTAKHQITPLHVAAKWGKSNMVALLLEKGAKIGASTRDGLTPLHCAARSGHETVVDQLLENGAPISAKTKNGLAPLHMSSQGDHVDSARILLYHKAPVDDVTVDYLTALHVAAHCGHVNVAKLLLDRNADPNARALNGFTPLHIACKKNRIKVVELLLKHGASIEATTESGLTPLHVASFMGCMNIVIFLLQNGANPDVPTVRGETPLHLAARANQTDIIRILLRNGAHVDAPAREEQTPLHIAARLGNVDIVSLLLQHGAAVDATTKDMYTALHVAAKEGQEEVASVLLDHGASLTAATKKGFTPLHMAAKYGNIKVARLLLHKDAPVDAQGKNGVTPLHVAAHYDHVNVALLLLDKGASPHATAKNGYTPLHIASKKNQMDISTTLLEYGAKANTESKAGFTSLHLAAQEGHTDMATLLIEHNADVNARAKNGLTPLHLCAQEDRVNVAEILVKNGAEIDPQTKAEYSPLHVACHFGQINMVRFLLQHGANVNSTTSYGYTPLHQAAQQGHNLIINLLLENQASPNIVSTQGQTPLSIAQRLGYISVVETLKVVTETVVTTTTTTVIEEKYKVVAPETMQETFMSDSEDDGGEETMLGDQSYRYLTADEMKSLGDDSLPIDVTKDERPTESMMLMKESSAAPLTIEEDHLSPQHSQMIESALYGSYSPDNVDISLTSVAPISAGRLKWKTFLVSFMVDARGGAMRGCRHSGVRVIIPPRKASMPMRITCRYLRKEKLAHPPPLMEGEACASRILEVGPVGARFLGPVIIEVPHFASLRGKEREITILRSDNGETWRDHTLEASEEAVQEVLSDSFDGEELSALEDLNTNRITRILTTDFPQYFAIITRIRQEVHAIGPEGGMVTSTVVPQVQAIFPEGALTKKIKVGLQAQPIQPDLVTKLLGNSVAVSPIVTVEPRRRKFHKPITLTIPVPQAATKGMINQYSGDAPTLRLLCSITGSSKSGGSSKAQWEDVTGSTPLTLVNECISFTTTVSARFWLMDCRQVNEATKFATELYQEVIHVPFMGKFVIFAKRYDTLEAQLRVFCMTDDKEDKTLESQEHFTEIAKSRDVEVLQNKPQYLEFAGNLVPITKSGDQLFLTFHAFRENRLPFSIRIKDPLQEPMGRIAFMKEPKVGRGEPQPVPICNLNIALPEVCKMDNISELVTLEKKYCFVQETGLAKPELIHRADLRLSDIARELDGDWEILALQLDISETEINSIKSDYPDDDRQQALIMLRQWMQKSGPKATGNSLEKALRKIRRDDIVKQCMFNVELVTDAVEKAVAKVHLDQSGFDTFKEELGSSRDASLRREVSLDVSYDEQDLIKETVHMTENGAEIIEKQIVSDEFVKEPAQAAKITQDQREEKAVKYISSVTVETQEVIRENVVKQGATETATTIVMEGEEVSEHDVHDHTAKLVESETWASEMDTSQVSISSLPEDEKSEPTTATISSSIAAEPESAAAEASTEEKDWSEIEDKNVQSKTVEGATSQETEVSVVPEVQGRPSELQGICSTIEPGTVHRTREIDIAAGIEELDEAQMKQLTPEEILSFAEKRDFFQRLSQTSIILPPDFSSSTKLTMTKGVKLIDESDARQGEVVEEQVSFAERLKFFQTGAEDENGSKPSSITGDSSALSDEGTEAERSITEKEFAEDKISGLKEKSSSSSEFTSENQVLKAEIQLFLRTGSGGEAIEISKIKDYSGLRKEASQESYVSEEEKQEVLETNLATYAAEETQINEEWEIINDDEIREARETLHLHIDKDKGIEETWEVFSKQKQELKSVEISPQITSETEEKEIEKTITELTTVVETTEFIKEKLKDDLIKSETKDEMKVEETMKTKGDTTLIMQKETTDSVEEKVKEDLVKSETEDEIKLEEITKTEGDTTLIMQKETTESFEEKVKEDLIQSENKEDIKVEGDTTLIIQKEMFYPQEEIDISYTLESEPLVKTEIKEKEIKVSSSEEIEDVCGETETKETVTKTIVRNIEKTIIRTVTNIKSGSNLETVKVAETESCIDDNTSKDLNTSDEIKFKEPLSKEITVPEKEITTEISPQENLDVSTKRTIIIEKKLNSKSNVISLVEKEEKILDISEIEKELKRDSPEKQIITQTGDELMYDDSDKKHIDFIQDEQYEYEGKLIPEVHPEIPSDLTKEDIEIETDSEFKMMQPLKSEDISHETKDTELEAEEEILKSASEIMDSTVTSLPLSHDESEDTEDDQKKSEHMVFESDTATKDTTESESESKDSLSNISVMEKADTIHLQALELEEEAVSHKESDISQLEMTELTDSKHLINKEYEMMESLASAEAFPVAITSTVVTEGNEIATTDQSTVIVRKISTIVSKTENVILEREYKKVKSDKTYKERLFDTDTDYIYSGKTEIPSAPLSNKKISPEYDEIIGTDQFTKVLPQDFVILSDNSITRETEYTTKQIVMDTVNSSLNEENIKNEISEESEIKSKQIQSEKIQNLEKILDVGNTKQVDRKNNLEKNGTDQMNVNENILQYDICEISENELIRNKKSEVILSKKKEKEIICLEQKDLNNKLISELEINNIKHKNFEFPETLTKESEFILKDKIDIFSHELIKNEKDQIIKYADPNSDFKYTEIDIFPISDEKLSEISHDVSFNKEYSKSNETDSRNIITEEEHVGIKLFPDKLEEQKESGKLNSKICVESIEYIPKEKNYEITSLTILEKKCKDSTIKENHLFSVKEKIIEDELNLEKEKQIINKDFKKSIREDPNCLDLTPKTTQFDERYYSPSEVSPAKEINVTTEISTDVGIKSEILKQTVDLLEKSDVYENEINAPTELKNADISETVVLDESKEISQKIGIQEIDSILIKDKTEHLKFENNLEKFEIENQIADDSKLECFEEKNQSLDVVSEKEQIKEYKIDDVSVFQKETFQSTSISSDYKTQHPNSSDYFSEGQTNGFSHSDDYQSYSPDDIPKADVLTRAEVSFPSALDTKESAYENVNKWMEKEMEIVKEMLKDRPDNMPSLENYESIIAFDGDLPTGDDELFKRSSPTVESFDDEAQVEKCDTDLILQMLNNVSCSEIELAEVRTEDEAPDIEEDISPAAEELCNSTLQEFIKEQTVNENFDQGANKEIPEKTTSAQFTSDIYEESELDKTKTKPTLDLYPQSSLEVEIGSHISDDISLDIDKNHVSCSENKIEVQQEKIPNTELLKCDTTSNVKTVLFPTALLKADAIHDSTSDTLTSSTVLSAKLADEASDNIYPQLNLSGKEEIKKESEDQFEVPMKKTEEKEIGIITTDKTTELLEEQTIDTYASPLVKEFQEEEKSEKFQKDKISDISISQSSKVEQYLESRTSEEYNIDLDTEILSKEEKDSSEVVKSLSEIEDKFIESLRVTEEIEIPEPIPDLTVKETTVEEVPEEKITEKQSITEILDSSDYEIKSEIVTITEQCSTKDIIHDAKFDDDSKKLKEEKAKIVEFIEPLSEIKKTEEIQYSKSLPSEVIDKTELLSDDGKKKSVEELIHSKSEMKETLIKETGATESTLLSYDVKTEISKLQEEESVIESIPDITIPESAPCITKQENFEDIKKQDEQKEETAVIDDIMPESTQHEFIDVSDLEDIEPELEIKAQPIVTTPVIERKLKTDRTQRKTHISVADVTEKYADTEVKHTEPIIFEPSDDDKESFGIECHHSTPDFRQMTDIDLEAILEEHAKEEQRRAASESIDTEEHDLTLLDKKEPEDLSVKSPIDIHSPISQSMPPISPPISLPKLDESECHSILSTDIDSCADIKTSHSKSESPLIPDVVDEKIEEQKLISENEYSDQEVFYAEPSSDITDAVQKTTDETSQSSIICEPESEAQIKYRTQMAFDNTAFMGIDNIDVGEAVNREMVRSPYEVVRMKFEDFEIGMTTEQSSVVPEEQVLSEEKISKLEIKEDKYESESVDKSLEIPSREEATKIAQEIIEEIRTEVAKSPLLQNASIKIPDEDDIKTDSQIFASDDKEIMPDMIQSDDGKLIPGEEIFPAEIETSTTKTDEIKPDDKIKELSYEKADETTFPTSKTFQLTKESMEIKESHIFITNGKIEAISSDVDLITDEYDNRQFPVSEEIDYTEDFHSQMSYIGKQDTSTKSVKETESFTSHANLNGPVAVSYIPEYDDETFTIEKIKETDVIDVTKDTFYDISQKSARQDIPESDLMHSENIENAFEESVSASDIKETEIFNEEEYIRTRISISDDQVDQEIKKILSDESQTEDDRLTDIIERPITPEPSDEILEEMLLPESEQLSKLATITQKTISISEEEICVKHTESEMIYPHQNVFSESETDEPTDITVNKFYETALTVDLESREGFPTESVFQQESAEIMEEAMDIGSDKCSDDIEETDNKTHFEYGVHFAAEPHYDEIPKYVESGYGDLYTHQEEDEEIFDEDLQESKNLIENNKQMFSDLDVLLGPKLYTKSGEHDDSSMSSLQEFERLEAEIATGRKLSQGSVDSLNGRPSISKSGEHDDVSMNSLTEFERLERECAEAERIESVAREEAARLSEIEEGHESQASETSQETLSGPEDMDSIDSDDYEKRLSEIDEIIRQAQTNVESFQVEPMPKQSLKSIRKTEIKSLSESLEKDIRPIDQIPSPTPKEQDSDSLDGNLNNIVLMQKETKELDICITELTPAKSSLTVESHDANEDSLNEDQDNSLEHDSLHEVKDHEQDSLKEDKTGDVDSLQEDQKILMQDSLYEEKDLDEDSLRESLELPKDELDVSQLSDKGIDTVEFDDSLHEECIASSKYLEHEPKFIPSLISSTDSLEPSSSTAATHATYQFETDSIMSSSLNSIQTSGEETLMASSTDSLDPNRMMQAYRNVVDSQLRRDTQDMYLDYEGNVQSAPDQTKSYMDKEGNIHPVSEIVKKLDVTNQTCVLNVSEEDQNIIDSIEESKTIKSLKDDTTSSKEYVSLDTTRIQSNVVTKDLSLTLTKDDVQDEEIDEEGNIIEKGKSPDVMHDSDEDDKDQTSISEDSLQKQVEDRFSDTKVISSRKGGEQVEEIKTVDELGNIRIIRRIRHIVTVQRDELSNPDIEKSEQAEPEVEETRTTDDKGNVKIIRRSRRIIKMPDSQSSDIDKHLQEFVQKSSVSDDSQITSPDVSQTDSLQEKYFQDPRCESPITRDMLSGRESVASIRSDFSDADSEIREIKTTDEKGNIIIRRIRRIVTPLPPDSNPSSGRESPYLKEPSETVEERRTVDEKGNVIIKRIRRIVKVQTKDTSETSPIPLVDNEELAKSDTACEESEPEECKFVDEDGNIKHIRRIKKIIKIPQTSNDEEALINDLLQKSEISDSISESSETFYKSDSKLINHVDHGGEETEKHLVQVKKSSSDDTQEPSIEEKFKDFLKKSIAQDSKDEKHEERIIDDKGNVVIIRTVKTSKVSEPKIHSQKFTGPDAEKQSLEFIKSFDTLHSTSQLQQYEATDGEGNIVRVTQEISAQPHVHSVSFSGESYEQDMESYMKNYEEKMHSSEPGSSPSISKSPTSVSNINVPYSTMKTTTHSVDESPIHTLSGTVSSSDTLPIHHEETKLMSEEIDNKELVQSYDSDDAIDSEEDEIIDYLKRGTSSFKEVEPPSDSKNGYSEESAKQL
ncbi:ankyrin-2-like isoform X12 [Centruroides vittatus]|uniref:ankyrin-2-like isoform X12 n=1 Tax=Centruroides vittatus TaxID=120091 RepID=UPI00350F2A56